MPILLDLDVAHDSGFTDEETRAIITRAGGFIESYDPCGPGGGNPNYHVTVPDEETGREVIRALYDGDGVDPSILDLEVYRC